MTLDELLDELREGILNDRTARVAGTSDYLWTDARLARYINEAQRRLAVRGLIIRDGTTDEVTKITLVEGQTVYPLHESVIAVVSAKRSDQDADLSRVGHSVLAAYRSPEENVFDFSYWTALPPGAPLAVSTDEEVLPDDCETATKVALRVYPAPDAATAASITLRLRVVRKPLCDLTLSNRGAVPEVPVDHQLDMLDWAAYLALRIVDDDAGAPRRAEEFRQRFELMVREARQTAMRKMFAPIPWRVGAQGWAWEH